MTPKNNIPSTPSFDHKRLIIACRLAEKANVTTALLTGKGEPTLYPQQVDDYLITINKYFPIIELQTNGIIIHKLKYDSWIKHWVKHGLTTVCLSVVHWENERNREIYLECNHRSYGEYPDLVETIKYLKSFGLSIRLSCIGISEYVDTYNKLYQLSRFCRENEVEQLTWRPVKCPTNSIDLDVQEKSRALSIPQAIVDDIAFTMRVRGTLLLDLVHDAKVYDLDGQNVCITNCLTRSSDASEVRQLIYFPDGHLRYDWEYEGAIIL
jgi:hypothetical protein